METYRGFEITEERDENNVLTLTARSDEYPDTVGVRANFAQASDLVWVLDADEEWVPHPAGRQVADFRHDADQAIEEQIDCYLDEEW